LIGLLEKYHLRELSVRSGRFEDFRDLVYYAIHGDFNVDKIQNSIRAYEAAIGEDEDAKDTFRKMLIEILSVLFQFVQAYRAAEPDLSNPFRSSRIERCEQIIQWISSHVDIDRDEYETMGCLQHYELQPSQD
jgi:hypothetical protein